MDERIRRIKKRKRKQQPIDVNLIALSLLGSTVGCLLLGLLVSWLRWLILVSASVDLIGGVVLVIYVLYAYDEDPVGGIENAPRTYFSGFVMFLGFAQLVLYVLLTMRRW